MKENFKTVHAAGNEAKAKRGVFLGIDPRIKGWIFLDIETRKVVVARTAIFNRWKGGSKYFDTYLARRTPVFHSFTDDDGTDVLNVHWSTEGAKQGDTLGSFLYDLTVADKVYEPLEEKCPQVIHAAATYDLSTSSHGSLR